MTTQPEALQLAEYWETRAKDLQTWVDENDYVEFGYRPEGLKREQADQRRTAAELRRLHKANAELLKALQPFVLANSSEEYINLMVRTADVTKARAAIAKHGGAA